jgi:hypothetical protein
MSSKLARVNKAAEAEWERSQGGKGGARPVFGERPEDSSSEDESSDPSSEESSVSSASSGSESGSESEEEQQAGSSSGAAAFPFNDKDKLIDGRKCAVRVFVIDIAGSPALFEEFPKRAEARIASAYSAMYRPSGTPTGDVRKGDIKNALLLNANVVWCHNSFVMPLMLQSTGIRGRYYSGDKQRGFFCAPPGLIQSNVGFAVQVPTRSLISETAKSYGNYSAGAHRVGVRKAGKYYLVKPGNVTFNLISGNQDNETAPYNLKKMARYGANKKLKHYEVPKYIVRSAHKCFHEKILTAKPTIDFSTTTVSISRLGGVPWGAPFGMTYPGSTESLDSKIANLRGTVTVALEIKYRLASA